MRYQNTITATFVSRLNRFTAEVEIPSETVNSKDGEFGKACKATSGEKGTESDKNNKIKMPVNREQVHVKNTGRIREFLLPGARVSLAISDNPNRKTGYDLIAVYSERLGWVNIDSQATNTVMKEWLLKQDFDLVKPEYKYGDSRVDFYLEKGDRRILLEVKGCTEEIDGIGYFPDVSTERGVKHLHELAGAVKEGYECRIAFVIGMPGIREVRPNDKIMPEFKTALEAAEKEGVGVLFATCLTSEDSFLIKEVLPKTNK